MKKRYSIQKVLLNWEGGNSTAERRCIIYSMHGKRKEQNIAVKNAYALKPIT
jgi:hypothetical protein